MNETSSVEPTPDFPGRTVAVRLGLALLVALFVVLVLAWRDNGQRAALEHTTELTAVGDAHYFPFPDQPWPIPFPAAVTFRGETFYPAEYRKREYNADDMTRAGQDEKTGYIIYLPPVRAKYAEERKRNPIYYLKVSPTEYLRLRNDKAE